MRIVTFVAVTLLLAAGSSWAQVPREITGPRTLNPARVNCTDLPVATRPVPTLVVKGSHSVDGRQSLATGDVIVIARALDDGLVVGQRYTARRLHEGSGQFRPGEGFGAVRNAGWVTITALDDLNALATVDFACDVIAPGDYLEPFVEVVLPTAAGPMGEPQFDDRARILFGSDRREIFGDGDTFSIDRGAVHGVVPGARFAIYRDRQIGMPLVHLGEAVVLEAGELTSKVVMVTVKDFVEVGDVAVPRR